VPFSESITELVWSPSWDHLATRYSFFGTHKAPSRRGIFSVNLFQMLLLPAERGPLGWLLGNLLNYIDICSDRWMALVGLVVKVT
jgi:hypothetical protein